MNDPWDVKSVRLSEQYVSCMKINGVPLLPPLLSKQCRKEMQYYKLLAKEVENRLAHLKTYDKGCTSSEESLNGLDNPACEHSTPQEKTAEVVDVTTHADETPSNLKVTNGIASPTKPDPNHTFSTAPKSPTSFDLPVEIPERDYNDSRELSKTKKTETHKDFEEICSEKFQKNFDYDVDFVDFSNTLFHGPSSLSSKSFTGSLNDLHSETKEMTVSTKLVRQNSYTILQPSPQLLAHLQDQSQSTGMDIMSISMSESMSNISSANKKRRSWDLESAKVKWSTMAMELKKKNLLNNLTRSTQKEKAPPKNIQKKTPFQPKSQTVDKLRKQDSKNVTKSEPIQKPKKTSPYSLTKNYPSDKTLVKADTLPRNQKEIKTKEEEITPIVPQGNDPATKVRELYEKIQKQQLLQMANLIEKQKKEQMLLQKLFDEQQNVLLKQLKTICPESPKEAKPAWGNPQHDSDSGPVSLSQLIHTPTQQSPEQRIVDSTRSSLQDTNKYIDHCDRVLKKSKDLSSSIKKKTQPNSVRNGNPPSSKLFSDGSVTRPITPVSGRRSTPASRKLNYETSASYDQDYDPMFTDRTNDTFADLNVTFPSDSDDCHQNTTVINHGNDEQFATSVQSALRNMEDTIQRSQKEMNQRKSFSFRNAPTSKELWAASRITAHARGFLVRRLLRTERVRGTVQTIKDALLCALQLHQDRDGIRGADVDLHRRLIQQITAACYCLHDTFIVSSPAERCAMIAADRAKRRASAAKLPPPSARHYRPTNAMSQSHTGAFPARVRRQMSVSQMSQSTNGNSAWNLMLPAAKNFVAFALMLIIPSIFLRVTVVLLLFYLLSWLSLLM